MFKGIIPLKNKLGKELDKEKKLYNLNYEFKNNNILYPPIKKRTTDKKIINKKMNKSRQNKKIKNGTKIDIYSNSGTENKILDKIENHKFPDIQKKTLIKLNQERTEKDSKRVYSDYELNELEYETAVKLDGRSLCKIYWATLQREHLIIFTFFNRHDYNIFSIKLSKLFLAICTDMAFNVFFFADKTMHNIYISGGKYDYIRQLAQMIYSTIISQILQIFINYLTMTDIQYYKIKKLLKEKNKNDKQFSFLINCIKYKIIIFYSFTFLLFLFFWYLISAFCAVYENTQSIFIADSISSFIMGLIYPFVLYLVPAGLRIISLKAKEKKNLKFLYIISDKIPIF
jgi:hypothetical protein